MYMCSSLWEGAETTRDDITCDKTTQSNIFYARDVLRHYTSMSQAPVRVSYGCDWRYVEIR